MNKKLLSILIASSTAAMLSSGPVLAQADDHESEMSNEKEMGGISSDSRHRNSNPLAGYDDDTSLTLQWNRGSSQRRRVHLKDKKWFHRGRKR